MARLYLAQQAAEVGLSVFQRRDEHIDPPALDPVGAPLCLGDEGVGSVQMQNLLILIHFAHLHQSVWTKER